MSNPLNSHTLVGRVGKNGIKVIANQGGSHTLLFNLAVEDNFQSVDPADGQRKYRTNFVPLRAFVSDKVQGIGSWENVGEGDLIAVSYAINAKPYTKDGKVQYPLTLEVEGFPTYLEPKATTQARAQRKAQAAAQASQPQAQAPAENTAAAPAQTGGETAEDLRRRLAELEAQQGGQAAQGSVEDYASDAPFGG